jgi:hypothetical protein
VLLKIKPGCYQQPGFYLAADARQTKNKGLHPAMDAIGSSIELTNSGARPTLHHLPDNILQAMLGTVLHLPALL